MKFKMMMKGVTTMSEEITEMIWRGAAHYANGMFIGLADYVETQDSVPKKIKDHINYLKSQMQKEIDKAIASTLPSPPTK